MTDRVAVVLASVGASGAVLETSLTRFADEVRGRGVVVVVDSTGGANEMARALTGVRVIRCDAGALAPELWRVGLDQSDSEFVAFSTTNMVPTVGWLDAMLGRLDATGAAAVGGPIEPAEGLSAVDRAVYLARFVNYMSPLSGSPEIEPPGDNAIYRRDRLSGMDNLMGRGFWESAIHRELRRRGERLVMTGGSEEFQEPGRVFGPGVLTPHPRPLSRKGRGEQDDARPSECCSPLRLRERVRVRGHSGPALTFHGGCRLRSTLLPRFRHARAYGATRASEMSPARRWAMVLSAPLVPPLLLARIFAALRRRKQPIVPWLSALPALAILLTAWAAGEAWGEVCGPTAETRKTASVFESISALGGGT